MRLKKQSLIFTAGIILLLLAAVWLLGGDFSAFFRWYLIVLVLGVGFYPMTSFLFADFADRGWLFSKTIGIAICGYVMWAFVSAGLLQFTNRRVVVVTLISAGVCWALFMLKPQKKVPDVNLILAEEFIFLAVFLMWTYFAGFRPEANGTEKFMDYGFMAAMNRSTALPPKDIWYGERTINYYYGGQYYGVFLAKLCYVPVQKAYNLFRMTVAAFGFSLPFAIVGYMVSDRLEKNRHRQVWAVIGGLLAGAAVSLAGNLHYVLYGLLGRVLRLPGYKDYWFPSSTRYIGYNPETNDKCIHEFPSYSFVLGDVHAHMVNVMFVLTVIGILYAWMRHMRLEELSRLEAQAAAEKKNRTHPPKYVAGSRRTRIRKFLLGNFLEPHLLLTAFFIGIFHWTNYWDFVIYFTVGLICMAFAALYRYLNDWKRTLSSLAVQIVMLIVVSTAVALPFTLRFRSPVSEVALAQTHTPLYQLLVLWGLPFVTFLALLIAVCAAFHARYALFAEKQRRKKEPVPQRAGAFFRLVPLPDRFALILGICAVGLILIPELVYVRDIYENGYARSNTMFKLTYQAFILFGLMMAYTFVRLLAASEKLGARPAGCVLLAVFSLTLGYFPYSVGEWFGNVFDHSKYQGLDATAYLEKTYPDDASLIRWMYRDISGQPLILEAPGDSYSEYCRVSAMTGLPTLEGWYVHEWLWRNDPADLNEKLADIESIYTGDSIDDALALTEKYGIRYIVVGSCERKKYPDLNEDVVMNLGNIVFRDGSSYVVAVRNAVKN